MAYDRQEALIRSSRAGAVPCYRSSYEAPAGSHSGALIFVHFLMLLYNELMPVPTLDFSVVVGLPASLLIFLVVFYAGNCWTRFFTLWDCTVDLSVLVHEWTRTAFLYDEQLRPSNRPPTWRRKSGARRAASSRPSTCYSWPSTRAPRKRTWMRSAG